MGLLSASAVRDHRPAEVVQSRGMRGPSRPWDNRSQSMRPIPSIFAFWASRRNLAGSGRRRFAVLATALLCLSAGFADAALPRAVARAFLDVQIPLTGVSAYVREVSAVHPAFSQQPRRPMNPASTMKLITTYAA